MANALVTAPDLYDEIAFGLLAKYATVDQLNTNSNSYKFLLSMPSTTPKALIRLVDKVLTADGKTIDEIKEATSRQVTLTPSKEKG